MKIPAKYRIIKKSIIIFLIIGLVFPWLVIMIDLTRQGDLPSEQFNQFMDVAYKFSHWPSYLLRVDSPKYFYFGVIINVIGWGILGAVIGSLTSLILKWRKKNV
jgi:hypothetical protein